MRLRTHIITVGVFLSAFLYFTSGIFNNSILLDTDEMYWISTAKIAPLLSTKDFTNIFWNEYYGFVNFNTAKFFYGIGLPMFGHTNVDEVGIPPQTYYKWESFSGKIFPSYSSLYPTLRDARLISAITASGAIAIMFLLSFSLTSSVLLALVASNILAAHPIVQYIATHALADSMFLLFELITLYLLSSVISRRDNQQSGVNLYYMAIGAALALLAGVKVNGIILLPCVIFILIRNICDRELKKCAITLTVLITSFVITFALLHPNLFFYPEVSLLTMIEERVIITKQHVIYFSQYDPSHVLFSFWDRLRSSLIHLFPLWFWLTGIVCLLFQYIYANIYNRKNRPDVLRIQFIFGSIFIWLCVLSYTVFDEQRYFLPVLPFLILTLLPFRTHIK